MATDAVVHLIDDDEGVRHAVAFLLTTSGFAVRVYESAIAFLAALPSV
jgi:two-component system, LuxR family, response regulator FixJ